MNSWRDSEGKTTFAGLLREVAAVPGIRRVRFTTSHPRDFTPDIIAAMEDTPAICNHVHLPCQSGSSKILAAMHREYTREQYLERIGWVQSARRSIALTTDIIVGFPGETREDFEQTITLLDEVKYDGVFAFKYSPRPNTPALKLHDEITEEEKSLRLQILLDRQREIQRAKYEQFVGNTLEVMVEGKREARGQLTGHSSDFAVVNFTSPQLIQPAMGSYVNVRITKAFPNSLLGEHVTVGVN